MNTSYNLQHVSEQVQFVLVSVESDIFLVPSCSKLERSQTCHLLQYLRTNILTFSHLISQYQLYSMSPVHFLSFKLTHGVDTFRFLNHFFAWKCTDVVKVNSFFFHSWEWKGLKKYFTNIILYELNHLETKRNSCSLRFCCSSPISFLN